METCYTLLWLSVECYINYYGAQLWAPVFFRYSTCGHMTTRGNWVKHFFKVMSYDLTLKISCVQLWSYEHNWNILVSTGNICYRLDATQKIERCSAYMIAVRPIAEAIGVASHRQLQKIKKDPRFSWQHMTSTGRDAKEYSMLCLPVRQLNGWLYK